MYLEQYEREVEAFLRRIITIDETWAEDYEPKLKRQPNGCDMRQVMCTWSSMNAMVRPSYDG